MTNRSALTSVAFAGLAAASLAGAGQQAPVFETTTEAVVVDVSVRSNGGVAAGLAAADFVVTDNGVTQHVDGVDPHAMPLDVTVVADVSGRTRGAWSGIESSADHLRRVNHDLDAIRGILRPDDRLRLIASDTDVQQIFAMQPPAPAAVQSMETQGLSSTFDALVAAMLRAPESGRRHLVIAWTKAIDTISTTDASTLRDVARRSDAVVHIVQRDVELRAGTAISIPTTVNPFSMNLLETQVRTWRPVMRNDATVLPEVAALTGGTFHALGVMRDPQLVAEFKEIFDDFRGGYVLRYSPSGVTREGWHDIAVTVPRLPGAEIQARKGYAIEASASRPANRPAAPGAAPRATPANMPAALAGLVTAFDRHDDAAVQSSLRQTTDLRSLMKDFRAAENPWPAQPKREAVFALELIVAGLIGRDSGTRDDALSLMRTYAELIRSPVKNDAFECGWHGVAVAALEGALQSTVADAVIPRLLGRCSAYGRLYLALAFASDQAIANSRSDTAAAGADVVFRRYEEAMAFPDVEREARVRAAGLAYRLGQYERAARYLQPVVPPGNDRAIDYLGELTRGQVLRAQGRFDQAIAAFRSALVARPGAQSARVALMMLVATHGDRGEAESLAEAIQADTGNQIDPWWLYWQGDYRILSVLEANLRELAE